MIEAVTATAPAALEEVRILFREYAAQVAEPCCFATFEDELAGLPGEYAPPAGRLLVAREGAAAAGCVALRRLDARSAEMKRLYVRDRYRGRGLGRKLAEAAIAEAATDGCARLVLDTLPRMREAIALYASLGFRETGPYSATPTPGARFFELKLP